jgi:hypothetical protein
MSSAGVRHRAKQEPEQPMCPVADHRGQARTNLELHFEPVRSRIVNANSCSRASTRRSKSPSCDHPPRSPMLDNDMTGSEHRIHTAVTVFKALTRGSVRKGGFGLGQGSAVWTLLTGDPGRSRPLPRPLFRARRAHRPTRRGPRSRPALGPACASRPSVTMSHHRRCREGTPATVDRDVAAAGSTRDRAVVPPVRRSLASRPELRQSNDERKRALGGQVRTR